MTHWTDLRCVICHNTLELARLAKVHITTIVRLEAVRAGQSGTITDRGECIGEGRHRAWRQWQRHPQAQGKAAALAYIIRKNAVTLKNVRGEAAFDRVTFSY